MARMGMDVDAVESAGRALKERASQLDTIVAALDRTVKSLNHVWEGKDAQTFVETWWPEHRTALVAMRSHVDGLGQSALNNASEQRGVSDEHGGGGGGGTAPHVGASAAAPADSATGSTTSPISSVPAAQQAFDQRGTTGVSNPAFGPGGDYDGECTSWVNFRRQQLGASVVPISWQNGNFYPGEITSTPTPGAVGSYAGHTFIVESVSSGPPQSISISEMNNSYLGGHGQVNLDTFTYDSARGQWVSPNLRDAKTITFGA
jgi:surface antigen/uncharacterized protein YukE